MPPTSPRLARLLERTWLRLLARLGRVQLSENTVLLAFAVAIGLAGALGVAVFYGLIDLAYLVFFDQLGARVPRGLDLLRRPLVTGAGLVGAWWIMRRLARGNDGLNIPDIQVAVARRGGHVPMRPALARTAASAVTMGSGGSVGSEGPVAVLGSAVGSSLGRLLRVEPARRRILVACGAAAAISAAFNAPLAGAFFALEQILGSLAVGAFPPVVVASVVAAVVTEGFFGTHPAFPTPPEHAVPLAREVLVLYPLLGVACGLVGAFFVKAYYGLGDALARLPGPGWVRPLVGGLLVGAAVNLSGGALVGRGHLALPPVLFGEGAWWLLLALALGKLLATSLTFGAGGSGGMFTPALYVGAALGGSFGVGASLLLPGWVDHPPAYALVGMGALVVAVLDAPLTGVLLVFEITGDYAVMLPLMLATGVAWVVGRKLAPDSLYAVWLRNRGESLEAGRDSTLLASLHVEDALDPDPQVVGEGATAAQLAEHLSPGTQTHFPVVDRRLRVVGMLEVAEIGHLVRDQAHLADVVVAADLAHPVEPLHPRTTLQEAMRRMGIRGVSTLPVVDPGTGRLVGILDRGHLLAAYERALAGPAGPAEGVGPPGEGPR